MGEPERPKAIGAYDRLPLYWELQAFEFLPRILKISHIDHAASGRWRRAGGFAARTKAGGARFIEKR